MSRLSDLGTLLGAMVAVVLSGEMPSAPGIDGLLSAKQKPKLIVPLVERFPDLINAAKWPTRGHSGYYPVKFLRDRFGIDHAAARDLLWMKVMPSSVQCALAREMASGDLQRAQLILDARTTKGIRVAVDSVSQRFGLPGHLPPTLWRFGGNADVLWFALRDEALRVRDLRKERLA